MRYQAIYVIRDDVSLTHSPLFLAPTQAAAERQLSQFVKQDGLANPNDYSLIPVGYFDSDECCLVTDAPFPTNKYKVGANVD